MSKTEKLIAQGKEIEVMGERLIVKPVSAKMMFSINREIAAGLHDMMAVVRGRGEGEEVLTPEFILTLVNFAPKLLNMFDKAIGKEGGYCENLAFADLSEVILVVLEVNDFERIVKNFKQTKLLVTAKKGLDKPSP